MRCCVQFQKRQIEVCPKKLPLVIAKMNKKICQRRRCGKFCRLKNPDFGDTGFFFKNYLLSYRSGLKPIQAVSSLQPSHLVPKSGKPSPATIPSPFYTWRAISSEGTFLSSRCATECRGFPSAPAIPGWGQDRGAVRWC